MPEIMKMIYIIEEYLLKYSTTGLFHFENVSTILNPSSGWIGSKLKNASEKFNEIERFKKLYKSVPYNDES